MATNMRVIGSRANTMAKECNIWRMVTFTPECGTWVRSQRKVCLRCTMETSTMVSGKTICLMERVFTFGLMERGMWETTRRVRSMESEFSLLRMGIGIMVSSSTVLKRASKPHISESEIIYIQKINN
jgi:hypothetical protein